METFGRIDILGNFAGRIDVWTYQVFGTMWSTVQYKERLCLAGTGSNKSSNGQFEDPRGKSSRPTGNLNHEKALLTVMLQCETPDVYERIFGEMRGKPVYVTNYRIANNKGKTDEELVEGY